MEDKRLNNLIPFDQRSEKERRELAVKGGVASGEARRKKKAMREQLETLMELPIQSDEAKRQMKAMGIASEDMNNQTAMLVAMLKKAVKGDVRAFKELTKVMENNTNDDDDEL